MHVKLSHYIAPMFYSKTLLFAGNAIDKISEDTSAPSRKPSGQTIANGVLSKSNNEQLYSHNDNGRTVPSEKTTRSNAKVFASSSSKKLNEDHNLNELENKSEQDGSRLANGHGVRSISGGKRTSPLRNTVLNGVDHDDEESDSGESSNTSSSSCPTSSKKESQNKSTQV